MCCFRLLDRCLAEAVWRAGGVSRLELPAHHRAVLDALQALYRSQYCKTQC